MLWKKIPENINKFIYWLEALPFYMNVQKEGGCVKWMLKYQNNCLYEETETQIKTAEELWSFVEKYINEK